MDFFPFFMWDLDNPDHERQFCKVCPECGEHAMATDQEIAAAKQGERETGDFFEHLSHDWNHWEAKHAA